MSGSALKAQLMNVKEVYLPLSSIRLFTNYVRKALFDQSFLSTFKRSQAMKELTASIEAISYNIRGADSPTLPLRVASRIL